MDKKINEITTEKLADMSNKLDEALKNVSDLYNSKEEEFDNAKQMMDETKAWIDDRLKKHFGVVVEKHEEVD